MPTVRFVTLGCRLNHAEEAICAGLFRECGWNVLPDGCEADLVVVRSCAVTRQAERSTLQLLRSLKKEENGKRPFVALIGCLERAMDKAAIIEAGADMVLPREEEPRLPEIAAGHITRFAAPAHVNLARACFPAASAKKETRSIAKPLAPFPRVECAQPWIKNEKAYLKVQDGCDCACSYCIVPYLRGPAVSYPVDTVLKDAHAMLSRGGVEEIVITGCNLASYRSGTDDLPRLLEKIAVAANEYGALVSMGSVEPAIADEGIVNVVSSFKNIKPFIHLPVQSGNSEVLKRARRRYDRETIRRILSLYKERISSLHLSADFITGLPGETEEAFLDTCSLVAEFRFDSVHVFPFSPRPGTEAWEDGSAPPRSVAKERAGRLRLFAEEAKKNRKSQA